MSAADLMEKFVGVRVLGNFSCQMGNNAMDVRKFPLKLTRLMSAFGNKVKSEVPVETTPFE